MISSVKKAIDILKLFGRKKQLLSLAEISSHIEMHKSSILRTLSTLVETGVLEKEPESGKYRLGLLVLELAGGVLDRYGFREQARPYLQKLAEETGEIVHLAILDGPDIIYLDKKGQAQPLTVSTEIWGRHPAYCSAMGKVMLAGMDRTELIKTLGEGPYERFTPNTITDFSELSRVLQCVREEGYAIDDEEAFPGIRCVAAPIEGANGRILAAISVTVPKQRMDEERTLDIAKTVKKTAQDISERSIGSRF